MANRTSTPLKQSDLTRCAKAMRAAGVAEWLVRVKPDGTIELVAGSAAVAADKNDWD